MLFNYLNKSEISTMVQLKPTPEDLDKISYSKNFLKEVIFKIDYSPIVLISKEISSDFQEKMRQDLLSLERQELTQFSTTFEPSGTGKSETTKKPLYVFWNKEKSIKISLSEAFISFESPSYGNFESFKFMIENVYNNFYQYYKPLNITRIGLRYINQISIKEGNPFDLDNYISPVLTHTLSNFFNDKTELARAIHQFTLNKGEYVLLFTYGILNGFFPARISQKEFLLDYDCSTNNVNEQNISQYLEDYHREIQLLFEKSIQDELRKLMRDK